MKIMVTGAGGMVGSHLVEMLYAQGHEVLGTYYKPTVDITEIPSQIRLVECDVRYALGVERLISGFLPEQIYHLAAQSYPTVSWEQPQATIETNIGGTINIFESVKAARLICTAYNPVVVVAGSSAEYGQSFAETDKTFVDENTPLKPLHPYGVSKVGQDLMAYQYFMNDGIRAKRARIFNTTGTRKAGDVTSDFVRRIIIDEKRGDFKTDEQGIKHFTLKTGNLQSCRAIMDQRDLCSALIMLAEKGEVGGVYNISSKWVYKVEEIVAIIENIINCKIETLVEQSLLRPTDEKLIAGDSSKLRKDTGWAQSIPLKQSVADMVDYWRRKGL